MAKVPSRPQGQAKKIGSLRRGEGCLCSFDPTVGHGIKKTGPALIIQNDVGNRYSTTVLQAAADTVAQALLPAESRIISTPFSVGPPSLGTSAGAAA